MITKKIKNTGYAILAGAVVSMTGATLATTAQAAPLKINPIPVEITQSSNLIEVRSGHGFKVKHRGFRKLNRGHRSKFRSNKSFKRGHVTRGSNKRFGSRQYVPTDSFRKSDQFHRGSAARLSIFAKVPRSR
jgi:hypothetical protein